MSRIQQLRLAHGVGDVSTAAEIRDQIVSLDGQGVARLADALTASDDRDWARSLAALPRDLDSLPPGMSGFVLRTRARALVELGRLEEAMNLLDGLIADDPQDVDALEIKGKALFRGRRFDESQAVLEHVVEVAPTHAEARLGLGTLMLAKGRPDLAVEHLKIALDLNPLDPRPYRALARVYLLMGDPQEGVGFVEDLLKNEALRQPELLMDLARLCSAAEDFDRLRTVLIEVQDISQIEPPHSIELARYWRELGDSEAIMALARSLERGADGRDLPRGAATALRAIAFELVGDVDAAIDANQRALQLVPDLWLAHERLGDLLSERDPEGAWSHVQRALALAPTNPDVKLTHAILAWRRGEAGARDAVEVVAHHPSMRAGLRRRARLALGE